MMQAARTAFVAELPYFERLNEYPFYEKIKVLLISLDFRKDYQPRLPVFIQKRNIRSEVGWLDERDANEWVPKFSESWSGAIPATFVFNAQKSSVLSGPLLLKKASCKSG